ncbi:hypothetical protein L1987_35731 [Smallanthus sonchifolius]|uniref:Uncharacterized protein n=1 Tax=Smallanthus sonchifolius TaxID=185202 RepID=A0ACB9HBM3_9ASTR|nr:hypothetical protein L1987_35731 [Smallanthus sonchifolius]
MFADFIHPKSKAIEEICNRMASWMKFMHTEGSVLLLVEALLESAWRLCKFSVIFGELSFSSIFLIWQICGSVVYEHIFDMTDLWGRWEKPLNSGWN